MAETVGLPAAMATEMILNGTLPDFGRESSAFLVVAEVIPPFAGEIPENGVLAPTLPHVYGPILQKLREEGVNCVEKVIQKGSRKRLKYGESPIMHRVI